MEVALVGAQPGQGTHLELGVGDPLQLAPCDPGMAAAQALCAPSREGQLHGAP